MIFQRKKHFSTLHNASVGKKLAYLLQACLISIMANLLINTAAFANHQWQVSVTIDEINNLHSGQPFRCLDPIPFGCDRADFYAVMWFADKNGNKVFCDKTDWIKNLDFPKPGWVCKINGESVQPTLEAPVTFSLDLWDYDGYEFNFDGDDQVDLSEGPGKTLTFTLNEGTSIVTNTGTQDTIDAVVFITTTATPVQTHSLPMSHLRVLHSPAVFITTDSAATVKAEAFGLFSSGYSLHGTDQMEIWIADENQIATKSEPAAPFKTCLSSSGTCSADISTLTTTPGRIAYKAVAVSGQQRLETGWRMVSVAEESVFLQPDPEAGVGYAGSPDLLAGVNTPTFGLPEPSKALDIALYPGTGFDVETNSLEFRNAVSAHIERFNQPPSSLLDHQNQVNFYVPPRLIPVAKSLSFRENTTTCDIIGGQINEGGGVSWEVNGVIHKLDCTDSGAFGWFTSKNDPSVGWHELHHTAFGLADEYCCETFYFPASPYPNIHPTKEACEADSLSNGNCKQISRVMRDSNNDPILDDNGNPRLQLIDRWRFDPDNDIMKSHQNNEPEQDGERRRIAWFFNQCGGGQC